MKQFSVLYSEDLDLDRSNVLTDFCFPWLDADAPRTEFRAVWNEEWLKFHFDVDDSDIVLGESGDRNTAVLGSDRVELFFASSSDLTMPYFGAEMDPRGWVYDYKATTYRQIDDSWSFPEFEFEGDIRPDGYSVTGTFSVAVLRDLECLKGDGQMTAGVFRAEFSQGNGEVIENWVSWIDPGTETPDFHVPSSFGGFEFVR